MVILFVKYVLQRKNGEERLYKNSGKDIKNGAILELCEDLPGKTAKRK